MKAKANLYCISALFLAVIAPLIFYEVIRPFRDMSVDGPIALGLWGIGGALGALCFFLKGRSKIFSAIGFTVNILPLLAALVLLWLLSHSNFAWH